LRKVATIVERRSRGKLFKTECRATGNLFTVRHALLDTMNAGHDDGVPASILREINYMRCLKGSHVQNLVAVEVKASCVKIQYEHHPYNLRDFMQQDMKTIDDTKNIGIGKIRNLMRSLVDALAKCHSSGVMHRNLKPDNILVNAEGDVLLTDFALGRQMIRA
jgi:cell division cycle 2-like